MDIIQTIQTYIFQNIYSSISQSAITFINSYGLYLIIAGLILLFIPKFIFRLIGLALVILALLVIFGMIA